MRRGVPGAGAALAVVVAASLVAAAARPAGADPGVVRSVTPPDHVLVDLPPGAYYEVPARWLHGAGLTEGVAPGWFAPGRTTTRAEVVTWLWRLAGRPAAPAGRFVDVPRGTWFTAAVDWAAATGLTTGVGGGSRFHPSAPLDRAQLVTLLWRRAGEPSAPPAGFVDVLRPAYYTAAVDWAAATALTTGVGGTDRFAPHDPLTRAEAATFLWREAGRPTPVAPLLPPFTATVSPIGPELAARMTGVSWRPGCPVPLSDLRHLELRHVGFDGRVRLGELVVHADAVAAVVAALADAYDARFPIERLALVDDAGGSDPAAMAANLTTAFNCRVVAGTTRWSEHAYGRAIDVNPVQNPYVSRSGAVAPLAGAAHVDRGWAVGRVLADGPVVAAFDAVGWGWGGRWTTVKDYQHFSATGR